MATSTIQRMDAATAVAAVDGQQHARLQIDCIELGRLRDVPLQVDDEAAGGRGIGRGPIWLSCAVVEAVNVVVMNTTLWKALRSGYATYHAEVFSC